MKITKATYSHPDQDGEFNIDADILLDNKHDFDCEFALVSAVLLNEKGICIAGTRDEIDDCYIEAKNSGSLNACFWGANKSLVGDITKMKLKVSVASYKLEHAKLGSVPCPEVGGFEFITKTTNLGGVAEVLGMSVDRFEGDDDDGEAQIRLRSAVRNIGESHIQRVKLKAKVMDKKDDEIADDECYDTIPSKASYIYDNRIYHVKSGKCKGANISITASIAVHMDSYTAEIVPTKEEN